MGNTFKFILEYREYIDNIENPENKIIEIIDGTAKEEPDLNVWAAIESLPDRYKNLLLEYFFEGMKQKQF